MIHHLTRSLLTLSILLANSTHANDDNQSNTAIIESDLDRRQVQGARIDTERFELGAFAGAIAVEDFNTNFIYGISGSFHLTKNIMLQANYGNSSIEKATFEEVSDGSFLADADRELSYYDVTAAYQILPGRSFFGSKKKYNSGLYLLAGIGQSEFAGESDLTYAIGTSYRTVVTDWMTVNLDFRDRMIQREFLKDDKLSHNLEITMGLNLLF